MYTKQQEDENNASRKERYSEELQTVNDLKQGNWMLHTKSIWEGVRSPSFLLVDGDMFWSRKSETALCVFHLSTCFAVITSTPDKGWDFQSHIALTCSLCHQTQLKHWKFCFSFYFCLPQKREIQGNEWKDSTIGLRKTIRDLCVSPHLAFCRKTDAFNVALVLTALLNLSL